jgi:hypothetical protein
MGACPKLRFSSRSLLRFQWHVVRMGNPYQNSLLQELLLWLAMEVEHALLYISQVQGYLILSSLGHWSRVSPPRSLWESSGHWGVEAWSLTLVSWQPRSNFLRWSICVHSFTPEGLLCSRCYDECPVRDKKERSLPSWSSAWETEGRRRWLALTGC